MKVRKYVVLGLAFAVAGCALAGLGGSLGGTAACDFLSSSQLADAGKVVAGLQGSPSSQIYQDALSKTGLLALIGPLYDKVWSIGQAAAADAMKNAPACQPATPNSPSAVVADNGTCTAVWVAACQTAIASFVQSFSVCVDSRLGLPTPVPVSS